MKIYCNILAGLAALAILFQPHTAPASPQVDDIPWENLCPKGTCGEAFLNYARYSWMDITTDVDSTKLSLLDDFLSKGGNIGEIVNSSANTRGDLVVSMFVELTDRSKDLPITIATRQANFAADVMKAGEPLSPEVVAGVVDRVERFSAQYDFQAKRLGQITIDKYRKASTMMRDYDTIWLDGTVKKKLFDKSIGEFSISYNRLIKYLIQRGPVFHKSVYQLLKKLEEGVLVVACKAPRVLFWGGKAIKPLALGYFAWQLGGNLVHAYDGEYGPLVYDAADAFSPVPGTGHKLKKKWGQFVAWCEEMKSYVTMDRYGQVEVQGITDIHGEAYDPSRQ